MILQDGLAHLSEKVSEPRTSAMQMAKEQL